MKNFFDIFFHKLSTAVIIRVLFILFFCPSVFESNGAVKNQMLQSAVGVNVEIAHTYKLQIRQWFK